MDELDNDRKKTSYKIPPKQKRDEKFSPDLEADLVEPFSGLPDGEDEKFDVPKRFDEGEDINSDENSDSEEPNAAQNPEEGKSSENEEEKEKKESGSQSSEHDGKYFVIPRGKAMCDKGSTFPNFKVTSHQKHYWNDEDGKADYLAVTEDDLTFNLPAAPFGSCSVKNGNPCTFAPAGKWQKPYEKVKVMGKSCLTEASELMCSIGGKITVMKHGQQSEAGKSNAIDANSAEQEILNPVVDYDEFKEEIEENDDRHAW